MHIQVRYQSGVLVVTRWYQMTCRREVKGPRAKARLAWDSPDVRKRAAVETTSSCYSFLY